MKIKKTNCLNCKKEFWTLYGAKFCSDCRSKRTKEKKKYYKEMKGGKREDGKL